MTENKLSEYKKFYKNPFIEDAITEIKGHIVKKYKTATKTSESAILQAFDPKTGDMLGHTQFVRQIEVDDAQFTKLYLSQFSAFFDLNTQAIKTFGYIMSKLIPKQDMFNFFITECLQYTGYKSKLSVYQGLTQLLNSNIIARGPSESHYFINPLVAFNGDRLSYINTYVKKSKLEKDPKQLDLFA